MRKRERKEEKEQRRPESAQQKLTLDKNYTIRFWGYPE